ncbi:MAG: class I SAM-dependent methyltransferase, partial [Chloroflexota bacterium]
MTEYTRQIEQFYSENAQHEWERMERHKTEFAVTLRVLAERLPAPPACILDVGGGPGRYAIELARRGYRVRLFDLSPGNLDLARQKADEAGVQLAGYELGDARDLQRFADGAFDSVLLMGPLYHLMDAAERLQAVREARRVLRPGGMLAAAFICRFAELRYAASRSVRWPVEQPELALGLLQTGQWPPSRPDGPAWAAYMAHPDEVEAPFWSSGLEVRGVWGVEGAVSMHEELVNALPEA